MSAAVQPEYTFTLTGPQAEVFTDSSRFRVLVAGRRFGKTYLAALELAAQAINHRASVCWYIAPTYRMAKEIAWDKLKAVLPPGYVSRKNETELSVELRNGSRIALKGADNPDSLRGLGLNFVVLDEFAMMSEDKKLWEEVIRPALSDRVGRALFVGTPAGYNYAYELYLAGRKPEPGWRSWQFTTIQGGNVPPEEIEDARQSLDPRRFRQEYEASFETLHGRVYDNFDRNANVAHVTDTGAELLVGMDFNINPMSCVIGVKAVDELHVVGAIEIPTSNTEETCHELKRRYPGRRIIVCPDPSGRQRRSSAPLGQTDLTILERHGFQVDAPSGPPPVPDRINAVQAMLKDAASKRRLFVHPRAGVLIKALDGHTYKDGTSIPDKDSGLDHITDALGYLVWQRFNLLHRPPQVRPFSISFGR